MKKKKVVIIGGGFGGISAAKELKSQDYEVLIIDKTNHHLFQPLLYQVATSALSPGDIAVPIRAIFSGQKNVRVIMDEVMAIDRNNKTLKLKEAEIPFDFLIVAPGSKHSYFAHSPWERYAPGLKTLNDALAIREKILCSLEEAEKIHDPMRAKKYLTFVIIGGGPTGVELAGAIAEIAKQTIMKDFRSFKPADTCIYLIEGTSRLLPAFSGSLSLKVKSDLEELGVKIILNTMVTDISARGVALGDRFIETANVIWAAGNVAPPLLKSLDTRLDRMGRVLVGKDLSIDEEQNIFVIGDSAALATENGNDLPAIAPVAMQQGKFVAAIIKSGLDKTDRPVFKYRDKGSMATVGRAKAVAEIKGLKLSGLLAWLAWCFVHIFYLIGFRNRFRVMAEWIWYYFTRRNGVRLIVGQAEKCGE